LGRIRVVTGSSINRMTDILKKRKKVLKIYNDALQSVRGEQCVKNYLYRHSKKLHFDKNIAILSIGKAAASMAAGAYAILSENIISGLVVTKENHLLGESLLSKFEYIGSSHPIPTQKSLHAGQKVIDFISNLPDSTRLLVLISGGASALVEKLKPNVKLDDLVRANAWLLSSGLNIEQINSIRQQLSMIKGGGLIPVAKHLNTINLLLSDVLSNEAAYIGSGLFVEPVKVIKKISIPDWLEILLDECTKCELESIAKPNICIDLVATNNMLLEQIIEISKKEGNIFKSDVALSASVEVEAKNIFSIITKGESGLYIWGGEPTVILPEQVGNGGRNQHLALLMAKHINGMSNTIILCIGTDGTDGNTKDAGAMVDGGTVQRGELEGHSVGKCLSAYNAAEFLNASGDVVNTGPTGTNVMDVVIAYKW